MSSDEARGDASHVGVLAVTALVVGHTIGVGIFLTPAEIVGGLASPVLTLGTWVACAVVILLGALAFGELAAAYPRAGGLYVYLKEAWGERVAFAYGWQCLLVMDPGITAALALGASQYAVIVWPAMAGSEVLVAVATIWILAAVSMAGLTLSARVVTALTVGKVLALLWIVVGVLASDRGSWTHFMSGATRPDSSPGLMAAWPPALVSVFFSFGGFWEASRIAADVRDPRRVVPRALAAGVACVTLLYIATTVAFIYLVPAREVTSATRLAAQVGEAIGGPAGPMVLAGIVLLSVGVSALALIIMAPRLYLEMSRDGLLPSILAATGGSTGAPILATLLLASLASVFATLGTLPQILSFFMCTALGFLALAAAGLVMIRRKKVESAFRLPGYPFTLAVFVVLILVVMALVAASMPAQAAAGLALTCLALPVHRFHRRKRHGERASRRQPPPDRGAQGAGGPDVSPRRSESSIDRR